MELLVKTVPRDKSDNKSVYSYLVIVIRAMNDVVCVS